MNNKEQILVDLKEKLKTIPKKPGCYQYKDKDGTIIYVGKAKNLYNRMHSYFVGSHDAKTTKLVSQICDFEYIITSSEIEAFILEINLIKKYTPKYNIMLTDDKTYPYICITKEKHPRLIYAREIKKNIGKVYGPYPNAKAAKEIVELLNRLYPLRKCRNIPKKECLYYHIHQCLAPCINNVDLHLYDNIYHQITTILNGNVKDAIKRSNILMEESSNKLDFEKAIEYRNLIHDLNIIGEKQKMEGYLLDTDVFGYYATNEYVSIQVFHLRDGKMIERNGFLYDNYDNEKDLFQEFIVQFYLVNHNPFPKNILISEGNEEELTRALNHKIMIPKIGKNLELIKLVCDNAKQKIDELIRKQEIEYQKTTGASDYLASLLGLKSIHHIEAFDNSNMLGMDAVSAMVRFSDGKPNRKMYRKYKIKTVVGANEAATMYEVVQRRYKDGNNLPDLIIMDGGAIQVNSCLKALEEIKQSIPVLGLIKNDKHQTESLLFDNKIIPLDKKSYAFKLLEQIQEEVHRYAITYFRNQHSKSTFLSSLDKIKGIGKVKKAQILKLLKEDNFKEEIKKLKLNDEQIKQILELLNL